MADTGCPETKSAGAASKTNPKVRFTFNLRKKWNPLRDH
jgi:hypothetical protein